METTIRRKKRRLVAAHFAGMSPSQKMKMISKMNEVSRKLQEGAGKRCKTTR
jgi:hypothetical protein